MQVVNVSNASYTDIIQQMIDTQYAVETSFVKNYNEIVLVSKTNDEKELDDIIIIK